jgi:membrane protease YdiL (CAAX protease family)
MSPNWRRVSLFYVVTFAVTHVMSLGYVMSGGSWGSPSSFAVANALMLCPALVALSLQRFVFREPFVEQFGLHFRPNRWFVFGWLLAPLVMIAALSFSLLLPHARYAGDMGGLPPEMASFKRLVTAIGIPPVASMLLIGLALGPTLNAVGGLGEEIGWRGFLYKELGSLGFWRCSLVTGLLWALCHVPLLLEGYPDPRHPIAGGIGVIAFAILLAPVLHFLRWRSGSVVVCGILHGTMSSTRLISVAFVRDAGPWGNAAIPMALVLANAALLVWLRHVDRKARLAAGVAGQE